MSLLPFTQALRDAVLRSTRSECILRFLRARFGSAPQTIADDLNAITDPEKLERLILPAALYASMQAFENVLREELSVPSPPLDAMQADAAHIVHQLRKMGKLS